MYKRTDGVPFFASKNTFSVYSTLILGIEVEATLADLQPPAKRS